MLLHVTSGHLAASAQPHGVMIGLILPRHRMDILSAASRAREVGAIEADLVIIVENFDMTCRG